MSGGTCPGGGGSVTGWVLYDVSRCRCRERVRTGTSRDERACVGGMVKAF